MRKWFVIVSQSKDQISSDLEGETVILHLKTGKYYGLDLVGSRIWNLIKESRSQEEIRKILLEEFDVGSVQCEEDLSTFLKRLQDEGMVEIKDAVPR